MAVAWLPPLLAHADSEALNFSCVAKRVDQKSTTNEKGEIAIDTEDWVYIVTLQNTTFTDMANVEVKYIIFYKQEELGSTAGPRLGKQSGSAKIDSIKGNDQAEFSTAPVKLEKSSLQGGRYFPNGARPQAEASLTGLWIRVYQNGNLIAEMAKPTNLPSKEKWAE